MYRLELANGIIICSTQAIHAVQLEKLQEKVFPSLADSQRLKREHYLKHIEIFPEGQFVALDGQRVVGMTTAIRLSEKYLAAKHRFDDLIQGGYCTTHDKNGEWLYGVDMGTDPDYRGKGIAKALYIARHNTCRILGLKGQYTMGMLSGYGALKSQMSAQDYYRKLSIGELSDPTVSMQIKIGFELKGLVEDYLDDPVCGNCCARLVLPVAKEI